MVLSEKGSSIGLGVDNLHRSLASAELKYDRFININIINQYDNLLKQCSEDDVNLTTKGDPEAAQCDSKVLIDNMLEQCSEDYANFITIVEPKAQIVGVVSGRTSGELNQDGRKKPVETCKVYTHVTVKPELSAKEVHDPLMASFTGNQSKDVKDNHKLYLVDKSTGVYANREIFLDSLASYVGYDRYYMESLCRYLAVITFMFGLIFLVITTLLLLPIFVYPTGDPTFMASMMIITGTLAFLLIFSGIHLKKFSIRT